MEEKLRNANEKLQIAENNLIVSKRQNEVCNAEKELIKSDMKSMECFSHENQTDTFQTSGNIIISLVRQMNSNRETDVCLGSSTSFGYITSSFCCEADEIFLYDIENSSDILFSSNSFWTKDSLNSEFRNPHTAYTRVAKIPVNGCDRDRSLA